MESLTAGPKEVAKKGKNKSKMAEESVVVAATNEKEELFAFTCTSDYATVAEKLQVPKSKLGTCIDSGASRDYCPDRSKFSNYRLIDQSITTADGQTVKAIGMGDMHIDLPNGSKRTKTVFKGAIHAPSMAFTLISISQLHKAGYTVMFNKGMCSIKHPKGLTIATIPRSDGLYHVLESAQNRSAHQANVASEKMNINEAHRRLGHISPVAIKHAISKGYITGIELDEQSKPEFCQACAKAKLACQPYPKESKTRAEKFGDRVHWDLWEPASVKSLNGHCYVAARIDDATHETKLYFQEKKSETFKSYKCDEAYIKTQTGNAIKIVCSD